MQEILAIHLKLNMLELWCTYDNKNQIKKLKNYHFLTITKN
jgi:hypothetical protein